VPRGGYDIARANPNLFAGTSCMKARLVGPQCFVLIMLPQKSLASSTIWPVLFRYACEFLCSWMPPKGIEIVQRSPLRENSGPMQFVETKELSSLSPREVKFVRYNFRLEDLRKSFKWRADVVSGGVPTRFSWPAPPHSKEKLLLRYILGLKEVV